MFSFSSFSKTTWIGLGVVAAALGYIFWPKKAHAAGNAPPPVLPVPRPGQGGKDLTSFYNQGHGDGLVDGGNDADNGLAYNAEPGRGGRTLPSDPSERASYTTGYNVGYAEGFGTSVKPFSVPTSDVGGPVTPDISKGTGAPKPTADYAGAAFNAGYASGKIDGYQDGKSGSGPNPHPDPATTETAFYKDNYIKGYNNAYGMFFEGGKHDSIVAPSSVGSGSSGMSDSSTPETMGESTASSAADALASAFTFGTRMPTTLVGQGMARGRILGGRGSQTYMPDYWWTSVPRVTPAHLGMTGWTMSGANVYGAMNYSHQPVRHPYRG